MRFWPRPIAVLGAGVSSLPSFGPCRAADSACCSFPRSLVHRGAGRSDRLAKGRELYEQGCQSCHGSDGRGNPQWESAVRPIEFTDCGTTSEATEVWTTVVKKGGPARGLDSAMPAFEGAYSDEEIGAIVAFIRGFCPQAERYPPGDLNFRRLLRTGKAFPEQEVVLRASHRPDAATRETEIEILYENRLGPTFQYELVLPLRTSTSVPGEAAGLGDIELEARRWCTSAMPDSRFSRSGWVSVLPTGSEHDGSRDGTVTFTPFLAYGKAWGTQRPAMHAGAEIPAHSAKADRSCGPHSVFSHALGSGHDGLHAGAGVVGAYNTRRTSTTTRVGRAVEAPQQARPRDRERRRPGADPS